MHQHSSLHQNKHTHTHFNQNGFFLFFFIFDFLLLELFLKHFPSLHLFFPLLLGFLGWTINFKPIPFTAYVLTFRFTSLNRNHSHFYVHKLNTTGNNPPWLLRCRPFENSAYRHTNMPESIDRNRQKVLILRSTFVDPPWCESRKVKRREFMRGRDNFEAGKTPRYM